MRILILEDNAERRTAMLEHIADSVPMFGVSFFETSDSMIGALRNIDPQEVALISLDNDLDPIVANGHLAHAGDGVAVARFLLNRSSDEFGDTARTPPVIIQPFLLVQQTRNHSPSDSNRTVRSTPQ